MKLFVRALRALEFLAVEPDPVDVLGAGQWRPDPVHPRAGGTALAWADAVDTPDSDA